MKKILSIGALLLGLAIVVPVPTVEAVRVSVALPPPIVFTAPPEVVVIPETYVYFVPDVEEEIFFYDGWWWRPWQGRWYRSRHYGSGWAYYRRVPYFYKRIPTGWRNYYRENRWRGHRWNHQRIPYQQLHSNWRGWQKNRHWEKQKAWGVEGLKYKPKSRKGKPRSKEAVKQKRPRDAKPQSRAPAKQRRPQDARPQGQPQ